MRIVWSALTLWLVGTLFVILTPMPRSMAQDAAVSDGFHAHIDDLKPGHIINGIIIDPGYPEESFEQASITGDGQVMLGDKVLVDDHGYLRVPAAELHRVLIGMGRSVYEAVAAEEPEPEDRVMTWPVLKPQGDGK